MASVHLEPWRTLRSEGGSSLALDGARLAIAGPARLGVWRHGMRIATVEAPAPSPGVPRFAGQRVYWGAGVLDLTSGKYTVIDAALPARCPGGGERPHVYAWSPNGERLLGSFSTGNPNASTRVTLFDARGGAAIATLWKGTSVPPQAAWIGERAIVVGFANPRVFDASGSPRFEIPLGGGTIVAIEAAANEQRLIVVDLNRAISWVDPENGSVLDRWDGPWLHAAVSADGQFVAALEPWGKLQFACIEHDRFRPIGAASAAQDAVVLAVAGRDIATLGGGELHLTQMTVECSDVGSH